MTAISIVRPYPKNLTPVIGTLLAWLETADLQAVRLPSGEEVLLVDGRIHPAFTPTQAVIDAAHLGKRALLAQMTEMRRFLGDAV
jgi:hypothetical protein